MKSDYNHFTDFLKDNSFIRWQLMPDESLEKEWNQFQQNNPHLQNDLEQATAYLKHTMLNKSTLTDTDRTQLLNRIEQTNRNNTNQRNKNRRNKKRIILISAILSSAAVVVLMISLNIFNLRKTSPLEPQQDVIIGNMLNDEDIQLVTSEQTVSFSQDLDLEFDDEGNVIASEKNSVDKKSLQAAKDELTKLIVPYGKRSRITLADGSTLWLNSGSVLEFPAQLTGNSREINLLAGELYIDVAQDNHRPFIVHTSDMQVQVYGTQFNVTVYPDQAQSVVLVQGSVGLHTAHGTEIILTPSEQATLGAEGMITTQKVNTQLYTSWKDGYLLLDHTPLHELLQQVERFYNLEINLNHSNELKNITCDGKLVLSDDIDNTMNTIAFLSNATYERDNGQVYILKKQP